MRTKIYLLLPLFLTLSLPVLINSGCCGTPEESDKIADLIVSSFSLDKTDVPVNDIVACVTFIANLFGGEDCADDEGYAAENFYTDYDVYYRQNASSGWSSIGSIAPGDRPFIDRVISGKEEPANIGIQLTQLGEYYFQAKADITNAVTERNEDNNNKNSGNATARSTDGAGASGIVTVYLTPNTDMKLLEENIKNNVFFKVVK